MSYQSPEPVTPEDVFETLTPYRQHGLPRNGGCCLATNQWGCATRYAQSGWSRGAARRRWRCHWRHWTPSFHPPLPDLELLRVTSWEERMATLRVISEVFFVAPEPMRRWTVDNPAFNLYAARWQGRIVAGLTTLQRDGVVGVYNVATASIARRRGIAGNLVIYALHEAAKPGRATRDPHRDPTGAAPLWRAWLPIGGVIEQWLPGPRLAHQLTGAGAAHGGRFYA